MTALKVSLLAILLTCALTLPENARAGEAGSPERGLGPWAWSVAGATIHQFDADLSDSEGEFDASRGYLQAGFGYAPDRRTSVSLALGFGYTHYDFSPGASIDGQNPWDDIRDYSLSVPIRFSPHEKSDVIVIPSVRTHYERGADADDGRTEGVLAGARWKFFDSLSLGPGFGWFSDLGGGTSAFPILLLDWQITEQLSLTTGGGLAASRGPGLSLDYTFNRQLKMGITARYEKVRFAMDRDSDAEIRFGEDKSIPLLLTLQYSPWPRTSVSVLVGAETGGSLRLDDRAGERLYGTNFSTTAVIGLAFASRF